MFAAFTRFADSLAVWSHGGIRVRVRVFPTDIQVITVGRTPGIPADKLARLIRDLKPETSGTIDVLQDGRGHWRIRVSGGLQRDGFDQRVRNVVVNS